MAGFLVTGAQILLNVINLRVISQHDILELLFRPLGDIKLKLLIHLIFSDDILGSSQDNLCSGCKVRVRLEQHVYMYVQRPNVDIALKL